MKICICLLSATVNGLPAHGQDASAAIARMYAAYAKVTGYSQSASSNLKEQLSSGPSNYIGFSSTLRFEKPNRLFVQVTSPRSGTVTAVSDGKTLLLYNSLKRQYSRQPAASNLTGLIKQMKNAGIATEAEPLYFLQGPASHRLASPKSKGSATINGAPCQVVTTAYRTEALMPGSNARVTLWIGAADGLLRKTELVLPPIQGKMRLVDRRTGRTSKEQAVSVTRSVTMVVQEFAANPAFPPDAFTFSPPPGSVEKQPTK